MYCIAARGMDVYITEAADMGFTLLDMNPHTTVKSKQ